MKVALAQCTAGTDPAANLDLVRRLATEAAAQGAELVVFPEATMCSFAAPRPEVAEPLDGPWATAVRDLAADLGLVILVGMFTTTPAAARVRNTLLVTGPGVEAHYDKIHLFDAYGYAESDQIEPGSDLVVVAIGGIRFGLSTCYDVRFPELYKALARAGAEVILVPASWAPGVRKVEQWRTLVTARALDATCTVIAVDQAEPPHTDDVHRRPTGVGHSLVAGPRGEILCELGPSPELALVDLDVDAVHSARATLPVLANSRFESRLVAGSAPPADVP